LANPGWSIEELKPGATYVDITTAMIDLAQSKIYADVDKVAGEHLQGIGEKAYTEAEKIFSVSRGNMLNPDVERVVSELVDRDWLGTGNYHDILQTGSRATARKVQTMLAQGYARGTSYEHLVEQVAAKMSQADKTGIYRMIYTEGTRVMAEASVKPVTDMGFTEYRLSTVGDNRVCEICREISQKTFRFEDRRPGVNFPPMHTMCRCTFYIVIGDRQAYIDNYVRAHGGDKAAPAELLNRAEG
jgi:SPP1 gp7 family putative phage head morphogenesis protein